MRWHLRSLRKPTGGILKDFSGKKKFQQGGDPALTKLGEERRKVEQTVGSNVKARLHNGKKAYVNTGDGKCVLADIQTVASTPDNPNYVRRNIMTKGCIIKTSVGEARVTSRPGQHGIIQAVLV